MKSAASSMTSMIAVEPDGLVGIESKTARFDQARNILQGIKTAFRMNLAGQVILGGELAAIKAELGFNGSGRRKESPQRADFLSPARTWAEWIREELNISVDTADRFIACFKVVEKRWGKEGLRLMISPFSSLDDQQRKDFIKIVNDLLKGDNQRTLLAELKILPVMKPITGGDTSKPRPADAGEAAAVVASVYFRNLYNDLAAAGKDVSTALHCRNFQLFLYALPLASPDTECVGLYDYQRLVAGAWDDLTKDMKALQDSIATAIAAKTEGEGKDLKKARKPKPKTPRK
jgi:hypothetical protein